MDFQAGRFHRQRDDAHVHGAVFHFFQNFVAEIPVDADLHGGKAPAVLRENFRQHVEAGRFVGADGQRAARRAGLVRHGAQRFVAQREKAPGVFEQRFARHGEPDGFPDAIEELLAVLLLELADLRAHRRLRAVELLAGAREAALLGNFNEM